MENQSLNYKNVWIVGDSYIRRGEERARETMGTSLGLDARVQWFGWGGLRWERLLPFIHQSLRGRAAPDVLLIHCGGNDLGNTKSLRLVADMKRDLQDLHRRFPGTKILLSAISQRRRWRTANPGKIDKTRKWGHHVTSVRTGGLNCGSAHGPTLRIQRSAEVKVQVILPCQTNGLGSL
ncbi:hypothetical protein SKAU_G00388180 [Synaphobranchus kaupii]|uniref:SGNH hydrolase-type esterase domain-containing protein n=1 Tax=Synaphobranchus kaupii TaxID=118154 RepID=A0A9Q1IDD0_SYNKA|nr:hypothetical protein SKAU_G00388180 [Synaphobranchus kaupii]